MTVKLTVTREGVFVEAFEFPDDHQRIVVGRNEEFRKANAAGRETLKGSKYLFLKNWGNLKRRIVYRSTSSTGSRICSHISGITFAPAGRRRCWTRMGTSSMLPQSSLQKV